MLYLDTSLLAPLFLPEATSTKVARFVERLPAGDLAVSSWTQVEFSSVLARAVRMRDMTADEATRAGTRFASVLAQSFIILLPGAVDFAVARKFVAHYETGLRAGDALHLAIAKNHAVERVYSLDRGMIRAGKTLGIPMSTGIRV